jgi:hypothetical protein
MGGQRITTEAFVEMFNGSSGYSEELRSFIALIPCGAILFKYVTRNTYGQMHHIKRRQIM